MKLVPQLEPLPKTRMQPRCGKTSPISDNVTEAISQIADSLLRGKQGIRLLEAGCGSASHVRISGPAYAVGVDISKEQLEKNTDVHERILGDIQEYPLPRDGFDVAVCWMVLEHLSRPKDALLNLFNAVNPEGLLILGFPNILSIKGLVTKITPFWFHELFYRVMKYSSTHFPTYLRLAILPSNVVNFAEANGFSLAFFHLMEGGVTQKVRKRFWFVNAAFLFMNSAARLLTGGRVESLLLDNCLMILQKRAEFSEGGQLVERSPRACVAPSSRKLSPEC